MPTIRTDRMLTSLPYYYRFSAIMTAIQSAQAEEYDAQEALDVDLQKQLYIQTATWGLKYWEYNLGIATKEADSYPIRRSRILSAWRGLASQFSKTLVKSICEAYANGEVDVTIDVPGQAVLVKFVGNKGIPENMNDLKAAVENVVHAHLGIEYTFTYLVWADLDAAGINWNELDAEGLTWDEYEVWTPV